MSQPEDTSLIHCNDCQFEGKVHASGSKQFLIFMLMLVSAAYFLPMIVAALAYMVYILSQSPTRMCPKCKSTNLSPIDQVSNQEKTEQNSTQSSDQTA